MAVGNEINLIKGDTDKTIAHGTEVIDLKISEDRIAVTDKKGIVTIYDFDGEKISQLAAHSKAISAFDVDFTHGFIVTTSIDKTTKIWGLEKGNLITELKYVGLLPPQSGI